MRAKTRKVCVKSRSLHAKAPIGFLNRMNFELAYLYKETVLLFFSSFNGCELENRGDVRPLRLTE